MATLVLEEPRSSIWQSLIEAIRGTEQDFTQGPISRAVFLLAIPMVLEMLMESLFAIVDVFWVTRLGSDAVATVGLTESMLTLVFSVAIGLSMFTTAMVARRTGEKDARGASTAAVQAIILGTTLAVLMGVPGFFLAPKLLALMGAPASVIATGHRYTSIVFGGSIAVMMLFLNNAIFRGAGDASAAMRVLWIANAINLLLDPCFIFGLGPFPALGVAGAAVSTLIGRSIGVLYQFWILTNGRSRIRVALADFRIVPRVIAALARVSTSGIVQFAVAHTSWILLVRIISAFGSIALAGYTIGIRIFIFVLLPAWGLSGAANHGGAESRGEETGPCPESCLDDVSLQRGVSGLRGRRLYCVSSSDRPALHQRSGCVGIRGRLSAHCRVGEPGVRVGNGNAAGVQRRGGHGDSDPHQRSWVLVLRSPPRVCVGVRGSHGCAWSVYVNPDRGGVYCAAELRAIRAREVEDASDIGPPFSKGRPHHQRSEVSDRRHRAIDQYLCRAGRRVVQLKRYL